MPQRMALDLRITDVDDGWHKVGRPRLLHATWLNSPEGKFEVITGTTLVTSHLADPEVREAIERNVRRAYEAHRGANG